MPRPRKLRYVQGRPIADAFIPDKVPPWGREEVLLPLEGLEAVKLNDAGRIPEAVGPLFKFFNRPVKLRHKEGADSGRTAPAALDPVIISGDLVFARHRNHPVGHEGRTAFSAETEDDIRGSAFREGVAVETDPLGGRDLHIHVVFIEVHLVVARTHDFFVAGERRFPPVLRTNRPAESFSARHPHENRTVRPRKLSPAVPCSGRCAILHPFASCG